MKALAMAAFAFGISTSVFAQNNPPTPTQSAPPSDSSGNTPIAPSVNPAGSANPLAAPGSPFINFQGQDQWLVGNLLNRHVFDSAGQSIGDLTDVLVNSDGKVIAVIIGVGGFLGLGEKSVAVDYEFLKQNGGVTGNRIVLSMDEQQLRAAPNFQRIKPMPPSNPPKTQ